MFTLSTPLSSLEGLCIVRAVRCGNVILSSLPGRLTTSKTFPCTRISSPIGLSGKHWIHQFEKGIHHYGNCDTIGYPAKRWCSQPGERWWRDRTLHNVWKIELLEPQKAYSGISNPSPQLLSCLEVLISLCQWLWCNLPLLKLAAWVIDRLYVDATCLVTRYNRHTFAYACAHSTPRAHATIQHQGLLSYHQCFMQSISICSSIWWTGWCSAWNNIQGSTYSTSCGGWCLHILALLDSTSHIVRWPIGVERRWKHLRRWLFHFQWRLFYTLWLAKGFPSQKPCCISRSRCIFISWHSTSTILKRQSSTWRIVWRSVIVERCFSRFRTSTSTKQVSEALNM